MPPLPVRLIPMAVGMLAAVECAGMVYIRATLGAVPVLLAVMQSLPHVLLCMAVAAVANSVLAVVLARRAECRVWWQGTLLTATAAAWIPALWTFAAHRSVFAIVPVMAMVFTLTRPWHGVSPNVVSHAGRMGLALSASAALQLGLVGVTVREAMVAVIGLAVAFVVLVLRARVSNPRAPSQPATWPVRWTVNSASAAAILTVVLLSGQLILQTLGLAPRPIEIKDLLDVLFRPRGAAASSTKGRPGDSTEQRSHPGIILHLENAVNVAVAPPVPRPPLQSGAPSLGKRDDTVIPFAGVYWFYILPDQQPPPESPVLYGSPDLKRYLSVEHLPVRMEARQNLGRVIGLNCCSRIDVAVRNADRYWGSIEMELIVADTRAGRQGTLSLGRQPVTNYSERSLRRSLGVPLRSTEESLSFIVPAARVLLGFDELRVVFHTSRVREDSSPQVAIDHFVLVPAGL